MQKNWYIIYTRPKCEKKVDAILSKRKIEHFLPINCKQINSGRRIRLVHEPLFDSYVFANISVSEIERVKLMDSVINLVFWKGKPVEVPDTEIEAIREFVTDYQNIRLEKSAINLNDTVRIVDRPKYSVEGNLITVKNTRVKLNLPSIGFNMVTEISQNNPINNKGTFQKTELQLLS